LEVHGIDRLFVITFVNSHGSVYIRDSKVSASQYQCERGRMIIVGLSSSCHGIFRGKQQLSAIKGS